MPTTCSYIRLYKDILHSINDGKISMAMMQTAVQLEPETESQPFAWT